MSLDVCLRAVKPVAVFDYNITHNLSRMAEEAGIYQYLWRPEELHIKVASELIVPLEAGLARLHAEPERFKAFNPSNGWGDYYGLVRFVEAYLDACRENPDATVEADR